MIQKSCKKKNISVFSATMRRFAGVVMMLVVVLLDGWDVGVVVAIGLLVARIVMVVMAVVGGVGMIIEEAIEADRERHSQTYARSQVRQTSRQRDRLNIH